MDDQDNGFTMPDQALANGEDTVPAAGLISQYVVSLEDKRGNGTEAARLRVHIGQGAASSSADGAFQRPRV